VGSTQRHWLHHPTDLWGGRVWAGVPRCRVIVTIPPHPDHPDWFYLSFVNWGFRGYESVESATLLRADRLLQPQPYNSGSLSVWVVFGREPTRPGVAGSYGPPSGVAFASWAVGFHTDADTLPQHLVHTSGAALHHHFGDRSTFGDS
jgi:hypothetical protein